MKKSTILIIEDHPMMRTSLRLALETAGDLIVVGEAGSVSEGLEKIALEKPDMILLDLYLPDGNGMDIIAARNKLYPDLKVLVVTSSPREDDLLAAIEAGADSYVIKDSTSRDLIASTRAVLAGQKYLTMEGIGVLMDRFRIQNRDNQHNNQMENDNNLSPREKDILRLLAQGASNTEIAEGLSIAESTVRTHFQRILRKMGMQNRSQAVVFAVKYFQA
jgi:two-component system nitrate/nitrite response regulator NarL